MGSFRAGVFILACYLLFVLVLGPRWMRNRKAFSLNQARPIKEVNPLLHQIWSDIRVRCQNCLTAECSWMGSTADLAAHSAGCLKPSKVDPAKHSETLRRAKDLESQVKTLQGTIASLRSELSNANSTISRLRNQLDESLVVVDRNYAYNRNNIVELTKLIVTYLDEPPASVNVNRIFNCIMNILRDYENTYSDYENGWIDDDPQEMREQCRMLCATAFASSWFSYRQYARFGEFRI